jgi:hypothetical protein
VERHVLGCPTCRARLERAGRALEALQLAASSDPGSGAAPGLWPALERQIQESRREPRGAWPRWLPLAASVLLAVGSLAVGAWAVGQRYQITFRPRPYPTVQIAKRPPRPVIRTADGGAPRASVTPPRGVGGVSHARAASRPAPAVPTN